MSTILKALKKLEQDKEPLGARDLSHAVATAASATGRSAGRFGSPKRLLRAAVIGAVFVGAAGAALYFYMQSGPAATQVRQSSESVRKPVPPPPASAPVRRAVNRPDSDASHSKRPAPQAKPAPQRKRPPDPSPRSATTDAVAQARPVLPKRIESRERFEQGQNLQKATPSDAATASSAEFDKIGPPRSRPAIPVAPTGSVPPADPKSEDDSAYTNAERLMDSRIKIQAIAWSPVPDERMAVINSRIVREGGSVEGFSVVAIRSDDVIVKEEGRLYRVLFGSP
jgi:type IV secretory pathway VirB10-like protein